MTKSRKKNKSVVNNVLQSETRCDVALDPPAPVAALRSSNFSDRLCWNPHEDPGPPRLQCKVQGSPLALEIDQLLLHLLPAELTAHRSLETAVGLFHRIEEGWVGRLRHHAKLKALFLRNSCVQVNTCAIMDKKDGFLIQIEQSSVLNKRVDKLLIPEKKKLCLNKAFRKRNDWRRNLPLMIHCCLLQFVVNQSMLRWYGHNKVDVASSRSVCKAPNSLSNFCSSLATSLENIESTFIDVDDVGSWR